MITALSHITFIVQDLDRTEYLLCTILDAKKVYDSLDKPFSLSAEKFFIVGGQWIAIMQGEALEQRSYNHLAFKIDASQKADYLERIKALGLEIRSDRSRVAGEGESIYFYDYDNHLFELHTGTLETRLKRYAQR